MVLFYNTGCQYWWLFRLLLCSTGCRYWLLRLHTPPLDGGPLLLDRVDPGHAAHLLGDVHTLLHGPEVGHQLGHVSAGLLGLQVTLLNRLGHDNSLYLVLAKCALKN